MDAMGGILTKGLGASACSHLIVGGFRLHLEDVHVPIEEIRRGGRGFIRDDSRAANIVRNKLNRNEQEDIKTIRKKQITITFSFNEKIHEKTFIVDVERGEKLVTAVNWINKTKNDISIIFDNLIKKK
jgi:hypothetical protein